MADRRLQVFHAVAEHLSFTRAAEALFMTQPAVTFQIRQLEEQYDTRFFERRHGSIALTPAGELAFSYARRILGLAGEMDTRLGEMTGEVRGVLPVGASAMIAECLMPGVLAGFNARHPQVRLRVFVAGSDEIAGRVAGHTVAEVTQAIALGQLRPPPRGTRVPAWLLAVLRRGLQPDPDLRFPTMEAMIRALDRGRARARGGLALASTLALATGVGGF